MIALIFAAALASGDSSNVNVTIQPTGPAYHCTVIEVLANNCMLSQAAAYRERNKERKAVGELLADGKCDEAMRLALRASDFGMARQVKELCVAPEKPASPAPPPPN